MRRFAPSRPPVLTLAQRETIATFNAGAARQHLKRVQALVGKNWLPALDSLIAERNATRLMDGLLAIAATHKQFLDSGGQAWPQRHVPEKTGVPATDEVLELVAAAIWRNADANWRFAEDLRYHMAKHISDASDLKLVAPH